MNKADSSHIASYLEQLGYSATSSADQADVVVVNSCVVRQSAENKVVNKLGNLRHLKKLGPDSALILTGCIVDSETDRLKRRFPHVDLFLQPQQWDALEWWAESGGLSPHEAETMPARQAPISALVPIVRGCNNFCSYCIVPYRRGRESSRAMGEVVCEVEELVERGSKEVTLLGQNVDSYGHDLPGRPDLADLLSELNGVRGLERIRFLTSHPKDMSEKLVRAVSHLEKVCEHISLPVQAGDDDILQAMGRGYTREDYRKLVEQVRSLVPEVALSTDVIVGFPSETENQFHSTLDLLQDTGFDTVHVAAYSPRAGTLASERFQDDVPADEKRRRREAVEDLQKGIATEINAGLLGTTVEVLVEGRKKEKWQGRTRTDKLVFFSDPADRLGQLVMVQIQKTSPWSLQGRVMGGG
jgi:tRNA-2-methylthio-N6-dimethylallyladenosine synthase